VLRLVGRTLHNSLKGKDTATRYGGGEFAIILLDPTSGGATSVAESIRKSIASKRLEKKVG
jgi:diguanylate cyclase